jgi:hypothetical protein
MACVVSSLETGNNVIIFCKKVNNFAFSLVAELSACDYRKHKALIRA